MNDFLESSSFWVESHPQLCVYRVHVVQPLAYIPVSVQNVQSRNVKSDSWGADIRYTVVSILCMYT